MAKNPSSNYQIAAIVKIGEINPALGIKFIRQIAQIENHPDQAMAQYTLTGSLEQVLNKLFSTSEEVVFGDHDAAQPSWDPKEIQ